MRVKDIKKWLHLNFKKRLQEFGIADWDIQIIFNTTPNYTCKAYVNTVRESKYCALYIMVKATNSLEELSLTLDHELGHIVTCGCDFVEKLLLFSMAGKNRKRRQEIDSILRQRDELLVVDFLHTLNAIREYNKNAKRNSRKN